MNSPRQSTRGLALIEMIVVVMIIALLAGLAYPATVRGLESIRLRTATDEVAAMLNGALERAERRQVAIEIAISKRRNTIILRSAEPGYERVLEMPQGIMITAVLPEVPVRYEAGAGMEDDTRSILVYPGGTAPRIAVQIGNSQGATRTISIDPITGVPRIERHG